MNRIVVLSVFALAVLPVLAVQAAETSSVPKVSPVDDPTFSNKPSTPHAGEPLFQRHCASCHLGQVPKAPHKMFLQMMSPDAIEAAMNQGVMRLQAVNLTADERRLVATYLGATSGRTRKLHVARERPRTSTRGGNPPLEAGTCTRQHPLHLGRGAGLTAADLPQLELKWALAFPGALRARSQPSVAYGAVYVGSQDGTVYALDLDTGCVRWTYRARAEVRTSIVQEPLALRPGAERHASRLLRRPDRLGLRGRCVHGRARLAAQGRRSSQCDGYRVAGLARRDAVCRRLLARGDFGGRRGLRVLYLPWLGSGARCRDGRAALEGLYRPGATPRERPHALGNPRAGSFGRAGLEHADGGSRTRRPLCRDR